MRMCVPIHVHVHVQHVPRARRMCIDACVHARAQRFGLAVLPPMLVLSPLSAVYGLAFESWASNELRGKKRFQIGAAVWLVVLGTRACACT